MQKWVVSDRVVRTLFIGGVIPSKKRKEIDSWGIVPLKEEEGCWLQEGPVCRD